MKIIPMCPCVESMFCTLTEQITENSDETIRLLWSNPGIYPYEALGLYDVLDGFSESINIEAVLIGTGHWWEAVPLMALGRDKLTVGANMKLHMEAPARYVMGTAKEILIDGEEKLFVDERLLNLLTVGSTVSFEQAKEMYHNRTVLKADQLIELGLVGGQYNG